MSYKILTKFEIPVKARFHALTDEGYKTLQWTTMKFLLSSGIGPNYQPQEHLICQTSDGRTIQGGTFDLTQKNPNGFLYNKSYMLEVPLMGSLSELLSVLENIQDLSQDKLNKIIEILTEDN